MQGVFPLNESVAIGRSRDAVYQAPVSPAVAEIRQHIAKQRARRWRLGAEAVRPGR
jgi:hypothetical protein